MKKSELLALKGSIYDYWLVPCDDDKREDDDEKELKKQICNSCATQRCYPDECETIKEVKDE
jgi:hypothetical protein